MSITTLKSYVSGQWTEGRAPFRPLHNPTTGAVVAQASSDGLDLAAALHFARTTGGPALRKLTFAQRGAVLDRAAKVLNDHREELIDLALDNGGNTRKDAKFDIDGASGTLAYYARLGAKLGNSTFLTDGEAERLSRNPRYIGQHISVARLGVAIHINAFNFPAWGMCEKAATAILAGMPVVTKPATSTAMVAARMVELFVEHEVFPAGALSALVGSTGDLLDHVGRQDVIAFTGSSATGAKIAGHPAVVRNNVRVNIEADSLNAAVLGPDVEQGSATWDLFLAEVVTDMTQKAGQKCTAIRRILVPTDLMEAVAEDLHSDLLGRKTGNPALREVTVGPLATASQLEDIRAGIDRLLSVTKRVGEADTDLVDVQGDGGFFVQPVLLQAADARAATAVHEHEVFGPVATLLPYDGSAADAVDIVRLGDGGLVTSVYSDREDFLAKMIFGLAPYHGRIHLGGKKIAEHSPGPGTVLPQMVHGGPGRAGSGEELGGLRGLSFYMQRTGVQGTAPILERLLGSK